MRVMEDHKIINAEAQISTKERDNLSVWQFWRCGLHDREEHADVFVYRNFEELGPKDKKVYAYLRTSQKGEKWLVVLNFSAEDV